MSGKPKFRARNEDGTPTNLDIHIGNRLRLRRSLRGLSQTQLAAKVGLTFQQIQKYERGANRISASRLYVLAEMLDVPVSFFFDDFEQDAEAAPKSEFIFDRAALEFLRAFSQIEDPGIRNNVLSMTRALASTLRKE